MLAGFRLDFFLNGVVIAAILILSAVVFFHNRKSKTAVLFLFLSLVSSFWSIFNYVSYYVSDYFWSLWSVRMVMFFAIYQAFLFFLLMMVFPKKTHRFSKKITFGLLPWVVFVSILTLTPFVFADVISSDTGSPEPKAAPGIALFAITAIPLVLAGVGIMISKLKKADQKDRPKFRSLFYGLALMFALIILFNFIFPVFFQIGSFVPLGALFIFPFVAATFWAISKHEFLNARIVTTEIFTFVLIVLAFVEAIGSRSFAEIVLRGLVFVALLIFGLLLVRATTHEVQQKERLQELTERLKALDDQKDEFISMAAHELRAPMTAIKGFVSLVLEGDAGAISDKAREFLSDANNINERLIRLVNNMLNVARIEEGRMVYRLEEESLSQITRTVFSQFVVEARQKGLQYQLEIEKDLKDKVKVDGDRLSEVMGNIISNAIKYTQKGAVIVKLKKARQGYVRFETVDTGSGISEKEKKKLFRKFYRVESDVGKTTGTGLGLYISKLLIEKFGGTIGVDSEVGKGSTFWFEIPLASSK